MVSSVGEWWAGKGAVLSSGRTRSNPKDGVECVRVGPDPRTGSEAFGSSLWFGTSDPEVDRNHASRWVHGVDPRADLSWVPADRILQEEEEKPPHGRERSKTSLRPGLGGVNPAPGTPR